MSSIRSIAWRLTLLCGGTVFAVLIAGSIAWVAYPRQVIVEPPFIAEQFAINTNDYYDLGAADINTDGRLDVFTTNHSSRQSLLIADRQGDFHERLSELQLDQIAGFPGAEDSGAAPEMSRPGLYIYYLQSTLNLVRIGNDGAVYAGTIGVPGETEIQKNENFVVSLSTVAGDFSRNDVTFENSGAGTLAVEVIRSAPTLVSFNTTVPLDKVFVGAHGVNPEKHEFSLLLKDRHGIAWADVNDDNQPDAFMSRGAIFGTSANIPGELGDEFFLSDRQGQYAERAAALGFEKRHCPARQVAWVDVNNDNRLDLYIACGRQVGGFWEYVPVFLRRNRDEAPNMLFVQDQSGAFVELAGQFGIDFRVGGTFLWLDADSDSDADLLWASEEEITLYRNNKGQFTPEVILPESTTIQVRKLAAADFDSDGDLDVLAVAAIGSKLLVNHPDGFRATDPQTYSLPGSIRTATWVDYDNDGLLDLYAWPGGLYRQQTEGKFEETELLRMPSPYWPLIDPRVLWFDADNDGDRDLLILQRFFPQIMQRTFPDAMPFTATFARNDANKQHNWLQFELRGSSGNRDAIGAQLRITTANGHQLSEVGQFDSSHYSQGHYRLYTGLGDRTRPDEIEVRWPDGTTQSIDPPTSRQLLQIVKPDGASPTNVE